MPRARRRGHQKRPGALDNAQNIAEMETAVASATLAELVECFDRVEAGEYAHESQWMRLAARKLIRDELFEKFRAWCRTAEESITDEQIALAAQQHRLPSAFWPSKIFEGARGKPRTRNALDAQKYDEACARRSEANKQRRYDEMTQHLRQRLHVRKHWVSIAAMRPELAAELSTSERQEFDALVQADRAARERDEVRAARPLSIVPRAEEGKK